MVQFLDINPFVRVSQSTLLRSLSSEPILTVAHSVIMIVLLSLSLSLSLSHTHLQTN